MKRKKILMVTVKFTENGKQYNYLYRGNNPVMVGSLARIVGNRGRVVDLPVLAVYPAVLRPGIHYKFVKIH